MLGTRAGFLAGLIITGIFGSPHHTHQGKYSQTPLERSVRLASLSVARPHATLASVTTRKKASAAVGHPVVRITHAALVRWTRVAWCEEHGDWDYEGSTYSGGLGILRSNWVPWARRFHLPLDAAHATPVEQIFVAERINAGYPVPDQGGYCVAW